MLVNNKLRNNIIINCKILNYNYIFFQASFPLFPLKIKFNPRNMLNVISIEIEKLKLFPSWDSTQVNTLENVISKFAFVCNPPERSKCWILITNLYLIII